MNFARAWLSRLIRLVTGQWASHPPYNEDRLQAARGGIEATIKPNPDYRRRRLAHLPPERVRRYWKNVESVGL